MLRIAQQQQQQWLYLPSSFLLLVAELRLFSTATQAKRAPPQKPPLPPPPLAEQAHFMVDYLVDSCGLSMTDAVRASKRLVHLKSPAKPDAVLHFLKEEGLSGCHIRRLVRGFPKVLVADAKKTLEPGIRALQEAGFSKPELAQLISANPYTLRLRQAVPKIEFWRNMLGDNEKLLRVAKDSYLMCHRLDDKVKPNLSFLRSVGVSDEDIAKIVVRRPRLICSTLSKIMSSIEQVKSLGITSGSGMFLPALLTVFNLSQTALEAKSKLLRSYGWSEDELLCALQKFPLFLAFSEKRISRAMDFLLKEAGCEPSYVAGSPRLLSYSIDKRLIPRCYVLQFLKKKGLPGGDRDLFSAMIMSDREFVDNYIAPVSGYVPELLETFPEVGAMINVMSH